MRRLSPTACLMAGLTLMTIALAWFTPFGAFPDELDHYERALSIGHGELVGQPNPEPPIAVAHKTCCAPGNATARAWVRQGVRLVAVDGERAPERLSCRDVVTSPRLSCGQTPPTGVRASAMGTVEPLAYAPGGLLARVVHSPSAAYRITRLLPALLALALIALGVAALGRRFRGPAVLAGIVGVMTVGTLSVIASGSPNALEVGGAVAFIAGGLAMSDIAAITRADWWCLALGGVALATSRSLGPFWIVALLVVAACAGSARRMLEQARAHRMAVTLVSGSVVVGALSTTAWETLVQPHVAFSPTFFLHQLGPSLGDSGFASRQFFASIGSLPLPIFTWLWLALLGAVIGAGLVSGDRSRRRPVFAAAVLLGGAFVLISAAVLRQNGFGIQARHVLPMVVALSVVGAVAAGDRRPSAIVAAFGGAIAAGLLVIAWAYLRGSYGLTPAGLAPIAPTLRSALHTLDSFASVVFAAGAVLAAGSIPLSAASDREPG